MLGETGGLQECAGDGQGDVAVEVARHEPVLALGPRGQEPFHGEGVLDGVLQGDAGALGQQLIVTRRYVVASGGHDLDHGGLAAVEVGRVDGAGMADDVGEGLDPEEVAGGDH